MNRAVCDVQLTHYVEIHTHCQMAIILIEECSTKCSMQLITEIFIDILYPALSSFYKHVQ
jgi:hypothetical protein